MGTVSAGTGVLRVVAALGLLASVLALTASPAGAGDLAREDPDGAQELAERYAPVMVLKAQEEACDSEGEPYGPTAADIVLDNPDVVLRQLGPGNPVVMVGPGSSDLFGRGEGFFLDFPGSALEPGCLYERDFNRYSDGLPAVVYAHVVQQEDTPDKLALQYWFYWYYNDWNNKHESDWEFIQVLFEASSIDEALATEPVSVGYAQHEGGELANWDASKLERSGSHPHVYPSAGSHASYFASALYMGRSGGEGFGCDNTDGPSDSFDPAVVVLPDSVDDPDDPLAWLGFEGRWGERQGGPFNGPTGPLAKDRWLEPIDWHNDLRSGSVVIPAGDSQGATVISAFCAIVEWGSGTLIQATTSPFRLAVSAFLTFLLARWLVRRTDWSLVSSSPLRARRRAGQIIRAAGNTYRRTPRPLLTFGLVFIPTAFLVGLITALAALIPFLHNLLELAGNASGSGFGFAFLAGSFASFAAYVVVNAMVAVFMDDERSDIERRPEEVGKQVWAHRWALIGGLFRGFVIVLILLISVVGIPWALRQVVRYQLMPQAVLLEGLNGKQGLARSSELVTGRWWHTAVMVALFNTLVAASGMVLGLLVLVVFTSLPIWLFSGIVTLIYALAVPLTATAQAMLYGDAVAEEREAPAHAAVSEPVPAG